MIWIFWLPFVVTGLVTRAITHIMHDPKNYTGKTLTGYLRRLTNREIHHIHIGALILSIVVLMIIMKDMQYPSASSITSIVMGAVGLSLISDQLFFITNKSSDYFKKGGYFGKKGIALSVVAHIMIGILITAWLLLTLSNQKVL